MPVMIVRVVTTEVIEKEWLVAVEAADDAEAEDVAYEHIDEYGLPVGAEFVGAMTHELTVESTEFVQPASLGTTPHIGIADTFARDIFGAWDDNEFEYED